MEAMRTPPPRKINVSSKTGHRKGAAGYRQGADRVPNDALLHQTGPYACRLHPVGTRAAC